MQIHDKHIHPTQILQEYTLTSQPKRPSVWHHTIEVDKLLIPVFIMQQLAELDDLFHSTVVVVVANSVHYFYVFAFQPKRQLCIYRSRACKGHQSVFT